MEVLIWSVHIYRTINIIILIKPYFPTMSSKYSTMATKSDMKWCWVLLTPWIKDDGSLVKNKKKTFPWFGQINSWESHMHPSEQERSNTDSSCGWNDPNAHCCLRQTQPLTCLHSNRACVNDALWPFTSRWRPGGVSVTSTGWLQPLAARVRSHMKISSLEKASIVSPPDKRRGWGIT